MNFWQSINFVEKEIVQKLNNIFDNFNLGLFWENNFWEIILFSFFVTFSYFLFNYLSRELENYYLKIGKIDKTKSLFLAKSSRALIFLLTFSFFLLWVIVFLGGDSILGQNLLRNIYLSTFLPLSYIFSFFLYHFFINDLKYKFIWNRLNYIFIALAFYLSLMWAPFMKKSFDSWELVNWIGNNILIAVLFSLPFFLLYFYSKAKVVGGADWKVIFAFSLLLAVLGGSSFAIVYLFLTLSLVVGAVIAIFLYLLDFFKIKKATKTLPLVPFLIFGFLVTYFFKVISIIDSGL